MNPVLLRRTNLCEREDLNCYAGIDFRLDDYYDTGKLSGTRADDFMAYSENSYNLHKNVAFNSSITRTLINAKELLKYAEKRIAEMSNVNRDMEVQQSYRPETISTTDKTLQHIQEIIIQKFKEINNFNKTVQNDQPKYKSEISSSVLKGANDNKYNLTKPNNITKYHQKYTHNICNKMLQRNYCYSTCKILDKQIKSKKMYTARSVQTDFNEAKPSLKKNSKLKKLNIQKAPTVTIPPSFKIQTLKNIHISPDSSMIFNSKNTETYRFRFDDTHKIRNNKNEENKLLKTDIKNNACELKIMVDKAVNVGDVHERLNSEKEFGFLIESKVIEKPPKIPSKNSKFHKCQEVQVQRINRKLNFNDSNLSNISLESIQFSDIDDVLKMNNQKLDNVLQKTSKMCKALHHHIVTNNFKSFETKSSTDQVSILNTLDIVSSSYESFSDHTDYKNNNVENQNENIKMMISNQNQVISFSSFNSSDLQFLEQQFSERPIIQQRNESDNNTNIQEISMQSVAKVNLETEIPTLDLSSKEKESINSNTIYNSEIKEENEMTIKSNLIKEDRVLLLSEIKAEPEESINTVNNSVGELHVANDYNIKGLIPRKNEKVDKIFTETKSVKDLSGVKIDDIKCNIGQMEIVHSRESFKNDISRVENDVEGINNENVNIKDIFPNEANKILNIVSNTDNNLTYKTNDNVSRFNGENSDKHSWEIDRWDSKNTNLENITKQPLNEVNLSESKISMNYSESIDEINDKERYQKHIQKCVDMNKSLAEQISAQLNKDMKEIMESTEKNLRISTLTSMENNAEENRPSFKTELLIYKNGISEGEHSEGEFQSSGACTHSLGEVKSNQLHHSINSKELCDTTISSKENTSIGTSISSNSLLFSLGEVWDKPVNSNASTCEVQIEQSR